MRWGRGQSRSPFRGRNPTSFSARAPAGIPAIRQFRAHCTSREADWLGVDPYGCWLSIKGLR
jgi:hypothetical protein